MRMYFFFCLLATFALGQKARQLGSGTSPSLPNTNDVTPSRGVGPLNKLVTVYRGLEKYSEAERYARRAVVIAEGAKGPESTELALTLVTWGDLLKAQKQATQAEQQYARAVKILERSNGPAAPEMLPALDGLGEAYLDLKRASDVEASWRRALSIRESMYGSSS